METPQDPNNNFQNPSNANRVMAGMFILAIGALLLLRQFGFPFPEWIFTWEVLLIAIGLYVGIKHNFRGPGWFVLILIGGVSLIDNFDPDLNIQRYSIPFVVIAVGLFIILRPKRCNPYKQGWKRYYRDHHKNWQNWDATPGNMYHPNPGIPPTPGSGFETSSGFQYSSEAGTSRDINSGTTSATSTGKYRPDMTTPEDYIEMSAVLSSLKRIVLSKNFKGGECQCFMGGAEIDLTQADIHGAIVLEVNQVMGGTKIKVPSNWDVKSEMNAVLGGIEDKRQVAGISIDRSKILIIKGSTVMGGIEITNY